MGKLYDDYFVKPLTKKQRIPLERFLGCAVTETIDNAALPKVGRPRKANKLTAAEKQRAYRERKKANG